MRPAFGCGVSFASFLCPDQRKEEDTPEGNRQPPQRYLPLGGLALAGSEYIALDVVVIVPRSIEQRTHGSDHRPKGGGRTKHAQSVRPALGCGVSFASFLCPDQRKEGDTPEGKKQPPRGIYLWGAAL